MRKSLLLLALLASQAAAASTVKIAVIAPLSGSLQTGGEAIRQGAELAMRDYAPELRRMGVDVKLEAFDDQGNATMGINQARKVVADPAFVGVVGSLASGVSIALSDVLRTGDLAQISANSTANEFTDRGLPNVNRVVARNDDQGLVMAQYASEVLKAKRVYVLSDSTTYGDGLAESFVKAAGSAGIEILGRVSTTKRSGFDDLVKLVSGRKPDMIYYGGQYDGALGFLNEYRTVDATTLFAGGDALDSPNFYRSGQASARGTVFTTVYGPVNRYSNSFLFVQKFKATYKAEPNIRALFAYDATRAMLSAVRDAAKAANTAPTRAQVMAALRKVNLERAVTGAIAFDQKGDRQRAPLFVMKVNDVFVPDVQRITIVRP